LELLAFSITQCVRCSFLEGVNLEVTDLAYADAYILGEAAKGNIYFPGICFPNTLCFLRGTTFDYVVK